MHDVALGAGQAYVFQTRSSSLRTRVKDVLARAETGGNKRPENRVYQESMCPEEWVRLAGLIPHCYIPLKLLF